MKVFVDSKPVSLTKNNYIGGGGEGECYAKGQVAYKIYHDPSKMIPVQKIGELQTIGLDTVLGPQKIINNSSGAPIGFTMRYVKTFEFLCKLFNKGFRKKNGFSSSHAIKLVEQMRNDLAQIHSNSILVVDYNEMNFLVDNSFSKVFNIDVDSYQTPSYPATAIMESIRDRQVTNGNFTEGSDWFSWAILACQMYIACHPFKGSHKDYKRSEWQKMMDDNVSIFHGEVKLPLAALETTNIPDAHLKYFEKVFVGGERIAPPAATATISTQAQAPKAKVSWSNDSFQIDNYLHANGDIQTIKRIGSVLYAFCGDGVYSNINGFKKVKQWASNESRLICSVGANYVYTSLRSDGTTDILSEDDQLVDNLGRVEAFESNDKIYTIVNGDLVENSFHNFSGKYIKSVKKVASCFDNAKCFDGVVFEDILGKAYFIAPIAFDRVLHIPAPELDGHRIVDAEQDKGFLITTSEKKGVYYRTSFLINKDSSYVVSQEKGPLDEVNLTVIDKGVCVTVSEDQYVELFVSPLKSKRVDNPPFDSSMKLMADGNTVFFANKKILYKCNLK